MKITLLHRVLGPVLALVLPWAGGCGPLFDPAHELKSLRVLGVKKDKPYAAPGETVELGMLWHDVEGREIVPRWFSGCTNPPGDLYLGCFEQLSRVTAALPEAEGMPPGALPPGVGLGFGDRFSFQIPDDILSSRPPPQDPKQPKYGLSYVFFAVCAGRLSSAPSEGEATFPVRCLDENDTPLGPDDFVAGYTAVYTFEGFGNQNPAFLGFESGGGFEFRGQRFEPDCVGEGCVPAANPLPDQPPPGEPPEIDCARPENAARCVPACEDDGDPTCDEHALRAIADPASAEADSVSAAIYDRQVQEQMWLNYYVDGGGLRSGVKLLNDATTGWNDEHGTDFFAPKSPGIVRIWAVAHDNRGGTEFARFSVRVE